MFCARCGGQIPDISEMCPLCGREATLNLPPPPPLPAAAAAPAPAQIRWPDDSQQFRAPVRRPDLEGIGGWLLFFCVSMTVLTPLFILARVGGSGFEVTTIIDLSFSAFGLFVGIMVWTVSAHAFLLLWIYFGLSAALQVLAIVASFLAPEQNPEQMFQLFRGLILTFVWFLYFKKSDRVQATFGRNL